MDAMMGILVVANLVMLLFVQLWLGAYLMGKVIKGG